MVIQRTILGSKRVELQSHPIIMPTSTSDVLSASDHNKLLNTALKYAVISWDGDTLGKITPTAEYRAAFAQYQTRVKQDLDIDVRDQAIIGA